MFSHRLEVESGRWVRQNMLPVHERKCCCFFCNILEDEIPFCFTMFSLFRIEKKYISKYFWKCPYMFKFIELINSSYNSCIRKLCIIIYIMLLNNEQGYYTIIEFKLAYGICSRWHYNT